MTAVGTNSGRHKGVIFSAGSFGSTGTIQPPVPGDVRRSIGHFGLVIISRINDAFIISAIFLVAAKELPGEARAIKLVQGGGLGPPVRRRWHSISPSSSALRHYY
jgi:hypothetical protein